MANKRNTPSTEITAVDWKRVHIGSMELLKTPIEIDDTTKPQFDERYFDTNGIGQILYKDPDDSGQGWFTEGDAPALWTKVLKSRKAYPKRMSAGSINNVQYYEVDADGNEIPRSANQAFLAPISGDEMRAKAEVDTIYAQKYQAAIDALVDLTDYHYNN
jgi:hypothetical protein